MISISKLTSLLACHTLEESQLSKLPHEAISSAVSSRVVEFKEISHDMKTQPNQLEETAELIASRGLARQFARLFPQVCGRLIL